MPFLLACAGALAQVPTTTTLKLTPSSIVDGGSTTVSVSVSSAAGTPTGSVGIYANSQQLFTLTLNNGAASETVPVNGYPAGNYSVTAKYSGGGVYSASQGSASATVLSPVSVSLQAVPNPVVSGQNAKLVATLSATDGGGTPTGTVTFSVGSQTIGSATVSNGQAVLSQSASGIPPGTYPVTATYGGDNLHAKGSGSQNVTIQAQGGTACGTGNEKILSGTYTFTLSGFSSGSETPYFTTGAFTANGAGSITGGEQDFNLFHSNSTAAISNVSAYSVGADNRGCMTLVTGTVTHTYRFSLANIGVQVAGTAAFGRMIEFDDTSGSGTRATGGFVQATTSEFTQADLGSHYSFGVGGFMQPSSVERAVLDGNFAISTSGAISSGVTDSNFNGTTELDQSFNSGTMSAPDGYGRSTLTFSAMGETFTFAAYEINDHFFYLIGTNTSGSVPVMAGEMRYAQPAFTTETIYPDWIDHLSGTAANSSSYEQVLARTVFTTAGKYTSTRYEYANGSASTVADSGTFTVSTTGRLVLNSSGGGTPQIYYMFYPLPSGSTGAFVVGQGAFVLGTQESVPTSGASDEQTSGTLTTAGTYDYGHDVMLEGTETDQSGTAAVSSSGVLTGTIDESGPAGLSPAVSLSVSPAFSFNSSGISDANGYVGAATGYNIYFLKENGTLNPLIDLSIAN